MKKVLCLLLAVVLMLGVAGCGTSTSSGNTESGAVESGKDSVRTEKKKFNIEDLNIRIENRLIEDERLTCFEYDNNSPYTISKVEIIYRLKDGSSIDAIKSLSESLSSADFDDFYIDGYCPIVIKAGESSKNAPFSINEKTALDTSSIFDYLNPEKLSIQYVGSDGYLHLIQHDYASGGDTESEEIEKAYQWSDSDLASMIPKPEAEIVTIDWDDSEEYEFKVRVSSRVFFDEYVQACKDAGFTFDHDADTNSYEAKNEAGYRLEIDYWSRSYDVEVSIEPPEE